MRVGVPKEVKNHEYRVAITPAGVHELVRTGTRCSSRRRRRRLVDPGRGVRRGRRDDPRRGRRSGRTGELILKVKEPIAAEYHRMREGQVLFTYLHLAADRPLTEALIERGSPDRLRDGADARRGAAAAGADDRGRRPAGAAGRCAPDAGEGGRGVLMGGVSAACTPPRSW